MINRMATIEYHRPSGARVVLELDKYENEPDFQSFALTRLVDPHDSSFATFSGFDVRSELVDLLDSTFADEESPDFGAARERLLDGFDSVIA